MTSDPELDRILARVAGRRTERAPAQDTAAALLLVDRTSQRHGFFRGRGVGLSVLQLVGRRSPGGGRGGRGRGRGRREVDRTIGRSDRRGPRQQRRDLGAAAPISEKWFSDDHTAFTAGSPQASTRASSGARSRSISSFSRAGTRADAREITVAAGEPLLAGTAEDPDTTADDAGHGHRPTQGLPRRRSALLGPAHRGRPLGHGQGRRRRRMVDRHRPAARDRRLHRRCPADAKRSAGRDQQQPPDRGPRGVPPGDHRALYRRAGRHARGRRQPAARAGQARGQLVRSVRPRRGDREVVLGDQSEYHYDTNVTDVHCDSPSQVECFARSRRGYCLHYATTMAMLLRAAIPPTRSRPGSSRASCPANASATSRRSGTTRRTPGSRCTSRAWLGAVRPHEPWAGRSVRAP